MPSWQQRLAAQARAAEEFELARAPKWVIHATDPPCFGHVWARRYTRQMYDAGERVAEDLSLMSTCFERRVMASFRTCEDGLHVLCEIDPPVEYLTVRPECMTGVTRALMRSGYHAKCSDGLGKSYEF